MTDQLCPVCRAAIRLPADDRTHPCHECKAELIVAADGVVERVETQD